VRRCCADDHSDVFAVQLSLHPRSTTLLKRLHVVVVALKLDLGSMPRPLPSLSIKCDPPLDS
jgi:hypothetical protein